MSAFGIGKAGLVGAGVAAAVALVAGCGSSSSTATPSSAGSSNALKTGSTSIGKVLVDASGRTVYELVGDTSSNALCPSDCLALWPAVMANGSQVVVNGHPVFTYAGDKAAGQATGQNVTDTWGRWLALGSDGNPIAAPAAGASTAPVSPAPSTSSKAPSGGGAAF